MLRVIVSLSRGVFIPKCDSLFLNNRPVMQARGIENRMEIAPFSFGRTAPRTTSVTSAVYRPIRVGV